MNTTTTLSRASAILIGTFLVSSVLSYAFAISMGWLLTPSGYGMLGVAQALMGITGLFIGAAFPFVVAKFIAEPDRQDTPAIFKSSLIANLALGILVCLLLYLSYEFGLLPLERGYLPLIIIVVAATLMASVTAVYRGLFEGLFRFRALGIIICIQPVVLLISSIVLVSLGFGASGAMLGYVVAALLALILYLYYTRGQKFWPAGSVINREVYAFAVPMFLGMIGVHLLMNVDILGVKFFIPGMSDVMSGYYRAALVWAKTPVALIGAISVAFLPFVSHYASDNERVKSYFLKTLKYAFIFILPLTLACFAIPGPLITLIFPESYVAGAQALRILSIGMFLLVLIFLYSTLFQGVGKPKIPALIMAGAIAIQIACLYLLVPRYGLTGAAMATTFASVFGFALLQYAYIKRYGFKLNVVDSGKIVLASVILLATFYFFPMSSRLLTVVGLMCGFGVFIGLLAAMKVLAYSDVDVLLSGAFSPESRFRSKVVGLVKRLNMAASESKSPRVRTVERYLPFILALAALVSAMVMLSEVAVAAIFAFTLVIYALRRYNSDILMVAALALLISAAIVFLWRGESAANQAAIAAFYFLAIGTISVLIDFIRRRNERNKT